MLDRFFRQRLNPFLNRVAALLDRLQVTPMQLTLGGFGCGLLLIPCLAWGAYGWALLLLLMNRVLDGLDGALARYQGQITDRGGYFDIVGDFIVYAGFVFGFALAQPTHALPAAFVLFAYMGTSSTFLAYAIMVAKTGPVERGHKTFYYLGGLTEGSETLLWMLLCCCLPQYFPALAWVFGGLCWLTVVSRMGLGWLTLSRVPDNSLP